MTLSKTLDIIALAKFRTRAGELRKSGAPGVRVGVKKRPLTAERKAKQPQAQPGAFVRVQRADIHSQPTLARVLSHGEHGITAMDATGRRVKVRHEHVVEKSARPTARERAEFATQLGSTGIPVSLEDRFLNLDPQGQPARRPSLSQLELLQEIARHGVPIDMARVGEHATFDEAEALLERYVTDPTGTIGLVRKNTLKQVKR